MLARSPAPAPSARKSKSGSWIHRLLDWFRGSPEQTVENRQPFNDRVREMLRQLRETQSDTSARLAFLRQHKTDLEAPFRDLTTAGNRHPAVALLGEALLKVEALAKGAPSDAAVGETWDAIEKALADFLGAAAATSVPRRDGFWK